MHCVYLADIAAIVSEHGPSILYRGEHVPSDVMTRYWVASRNRFDLWHQAMSRYRSAETAGDDRRLRSWWSDHLVILEEVLVSQMLTRMIAALGSELDAKTGGDELTPVTHAVYLSQLEALNRVHQLMLEGRGISVPEIVKLNRLRQGVERWSDSLLGRMKHLSTESICYAIDPERVRTYAEETQSYGNGETRRTVLWLMNASMRDMLSRRTSSRPALPRANRAVASSVALMLRPELFDSVGVLRSLWLNRLQLDNERTDGMNLRPTSQGTKPHDDLKGNVASKDCVFQRWYI